MTARYYKSSQPKNQGMKKKIGNAVERLFQGDNSNSSKSITKSPTLQKLSLTGGDKNKVLKLPKPFKETITQVIQNIDELYSHRSKTTTGYYASQIKSPKRMAFKLPRINSKPELRKTRIKNPYTIGVRSPKTMRNFKKLPNKPVDLLAGFKRSSRNYQK